MPEREWVLIDRCLHSESVLIHFPSWSQAQPAASAPFPIFRGSTSSSSRDQFSLNDLDICKLADADETLSGAKLPLSRLLQFGSFSPPLSQRFAIHGGPCKIPTNRENQGSERINRYMLPAIRIIASSMEHVIVCKNKAIINLVEKHPIFFNGEIESLMDPSSWMFYAIREIASQVGWSPRCNAILRCLRAGRRSYPCI